MIGQEIPGEQDYAHYYNGLMQYLNGIQKDHRPCHFAIKSNFFRIAYTFNFVVPKECPEFFWNREAAVTEGWEEHKLDDFIDELPDQFHLELDRAMIKGLLTKIQEHGTGPDTRFFRTRANACWMVSARMLVIVGVEDLAKMPGFSVPTGDGYQKEVSYSAQL